MEEISASFSEAWEDTCRGTRGAKGEERRAIEGLDALEDEGGEETWT